MAQSVRFVIYRDQNLDPYHPHKNLTQGRGPAIPVPEEAEPGRSLELIGQPSQPIHIQWETENRVRAPTSSTHVHEGLCTHVNHLNTANPGPFISSLP